MENRRVCRRPGRPCSSGSSAQPTGCFMSSHPSLHSPLAAICWEGLTQTKQVLTHFRAVLLHVIKRHHLCADEAPLKVGVDSARRLRCLGVLADLPAAHLCSTKGGSERRLGVEVGEACRAVVCSHTSASSAPTGAEFGCMTSVHKRTSCMPAVKW